MPGTDCGLCVEDEASILEDRGETQSESEYACAVIQVPDQRQDGGVEGLKVTSSHDNNKITTNCWTSINKKDWNLLKDIL